MPSNDTVNQINGGPVVHPTHYDIPGFPPGTQIWDLTQHMPHCLGSAIEYMWRAGKKQGNARLQELEKAQQWLQKEIEREQVFRPLVNPGDDAKPLNRPTSEQVAQFLDEARSPT